MLCIDTITVNWHFLHSAELLCINFTGICICESANSEVHGCTMAILGSKLITGTGSNRIK